MRNAPGIMSVHTRIYIAVVSSVALSCAASPPLSSPPLPGAYGRMVDRDEHDDDHDGVLDAQDECPHRGTRANSIDHPNGCPSPEYADRDSDGAFDGTDMCPDEPENLNGYADSDGCPEPQENAWRMAAPAIAVPPFPPP